MSKNLAFYDPSSKKLHDLTDINPRRLLGTHHAVSNWTTGPSQLAKSENLGGGMKDYKFIWRKLFCSYCGCPNVGAQCYRQWVYQAPLCITVRNKTWIHNNLFKNLFLRFHFMQQFSVDAAIFSKKILQFLPTKNWKDHKLLRSTFFPYCPELSNSPNRRIHVRKCDL